MSNELLDKLFEASPKKEADLFGFSLKVNPIDPAEREKKKKKKEEDVHEYIKLAEQPNPKIEKSVKKWKEEQTLTPQQIRQKKEFERINQKFQKAKKEVASSNHSQKKQYMPKIINPFEKPEKKAINPSTAPKKEVQRARPKEEESQAKKPTKVEAKENKIALKATEKKESEARKQQKQGKEGQKEGKQEEKRAQKNQGSKDPKKHRKESSSSSSSSSESDWQKQLRKLTGYNPHDIKYKIRDQYEIKVSSANRMFEEDQFSRRKGIEEQEQDLRRQMMQKKSKHKHKH